MQNTLMESLKRMSERVWNPLKDKFEPGPVAVRQGVITAPHYYYTAPYITRLAESISKSGDEIKRIIFGVEDGGKLRRLVDDVSITTKAGIVFLKEIATDLELLGDSPKRLIGPVDLLPDWLKPYLVEIKTFDIFSSMSGDKVKISLSPTFVLRVQHYETPELEALLFGLFLKTFEMPQVVNAIPSKESLEVLGNLEGVLITTPEPNQNGLVNIPFIVSDRCLELTPPDSKLLRKVVELGVPILHLGVYYTPEASRCEVVVETNEGRVNFVENFE